MNADLNIKQVTSNEYHWDNVPAPSILFLKDRGVDVWIGCAGGLYRINTEGEVINIKTNGPWR